MSTTIFNKLALALPIQIRYNYQQIKMINYLFFCLMKTGASFRPWFLWQAADCICVRLCMKMGIRIIPAFQFKWWKVGAISRRVVRCGRLSCQFMFPSWKATAQEENRKECCWISVGASRRGCLWEESCGLLSFYKIGRIVTPKKLFSKHFALLLVTNTVLLLYFIPYA